MNTQSRSHGIPPAGMTMDDAEMLGLTEPTTEPGRTLLRQWAGHENEPEVATVVLAIEEAARAEGRREAVRGHREIVDSLDRLSRAVLVGTDGQALAAAARTLLHEVLTEQTDRLLSGHYCLHPSTCGVSGFRCSNAIEAEDRARVAALNASESPPTPPIRIAGDDNPDNDLWTCSCGLTRPVTGSYGCVDCGDGRPDSWDRVGDASESVQPPESHDDE